MIKVIVGNNAGRHSVLTDASATLRSVFENEGIDYDIGVSSLNGTTVSNRDLDKSFADFGITEKCYLVNTVKTDNAACAKIIGNACVIESSATLGEIKMLEKYRPEALVLFDNKEKKEGLFRVGTTKGNGCINRYGASFSLSGADNKKAAITMMIPDGVENAKAWVSDQIGATLLMLNKVEAQFESAKEAVVADKAAIDAAITIV